MKRRPGLGLVIVALLLISWLACSLMERTSTPAPTPTLAATETGGNAEPTAVPTATTPPEPTATAVPEPTSTPEPEGASIEVYNATEKDIHFVYISSAKQDSWGDNVIEGRVISPGSSYIIEGVTPGLYDLMASDVDDIAIQTLWDVQVDGQVTWTVESMAALDIYNSSPYTIALLYISSTDSDTWGDDWLGGTTIAPGDSYSVSSLDVGSYDLRAETSEGEVVESLYNILIDGPFMWDVVGKVGLPSNAVLRFEEEFSNNRNNWGESTEGTDVYYRPPTDGQYCITIKSSDLTAWEWYEPFRPDEFIAEVACSIDEDTDASCGLGFGPDGDNLYWFEVSPSDQSYALFLLLDDEWQDSLIGWTQSNHIQTYGWNYLGLERINGVVSVYVNGILLEQVDSGYFPTGRVGLGGATYDDPNVDVCLDDLRVWRIE